MSLKPKLGMSIKPKLDMNLKQNMGFEFEIKYGILMSFKTEFLNCRLSLYMVYQR
jgi:hypothetical protein